MNKKSDSAWQRGAPMLEVRLEYTHGQESPFPEARRVIHAILVNEGLNEGKIAYEGVLERYLGFEIRLASELADRVDAIRERIESALKEIPTSPKFNIKKLKQ